MLLFEREKLITVVGFFLFFRISISKKEDTDWQAYRIWIYTWHRCDMLFVFCSEIWIRLLKTRRRRLRLRHFKQTTKILYEISFIVILYTRIYVRFYARELQFYNSYVHISNADASSLLLSFLSPGSIHNLKIQFKKLSTHIYIYYIYCSFYSTIWITATWNTTTNLIIINKTTTHITTKTWRSHEKKPCVREREQDSIMLI